MKSILYKFKCKVLELLKKLAKEDDRIFILNKNIFDDELQIVQATLA
jgi:hypothetical protein